MRSRKEAGGKLMAPKRGVSEAMIAADRRGEKGKRASGQSGFLLDVRRGGNRLELGLCGGLWLLVAEARTPKGQQAA